MYPSPSGKPLLTLRYKALKKGIQLFELLETYRRVCGEEAYAEAVSTVVKDTQTDKYYSGGHDYNDVMSTDWQDYEALMVKILQQLAEKA